jgi:hypothetical protein
MHATLTYKQNIMRVPVKIYNIFKNRYQLQKEYLEKSVPGLEDILEPMERQTGLRLHLPKLLPLKT